MKTGNALLAAGLLLLAGCSHHQPIKPECVNGLNAAQCAYLHDVQKTMLTSFNETVARKYLGKSCLVTAQRRPNGIYSVIRTEGDEALCLRAWQNVSSARNLPLPPVGMPEDMQFSFGAEAQSGAR